LKSHIKSVPTTSQSRSVELVDRHSPVTRLRRPATKLPTDGWEIDAGLDRQSVFRPAGTDGRADQNSARPPIRWYTLNAGRPVDRLEAPAALIYVVPVVVMVRAMGSDAERRDEQRANSDNTLWYLCLISRLGQVGTRWKRKRTSIEEDVSLER